MHALLKPGIIGPAFELCSISIWWHHTLAKDFPNFSQNDNILLFFPSHSALSHSLRWIAVFVFTHQYIVFQYNHLDTIFIFWTHHQNYYFLKLCYYLFYRTILLIFKLQSLVSNNNFKKPSAKIRHNRSHETCSFLNNNTNFSIKMANWNTI